MSEIGFEVGEDLVRRPTGQMEEVDWSTIAIGHIVRDKVDRFHTVIDQAAGWIKLRAAKDDKEAAMKQPTAGKVWIYVPSDEECVDLLYAELGARLLRDIEEREHSIARALNWVIAPTKNTALALRDHIDMIHNINVDDVLRKNKGTAANPASKAQKAASLQELRDLHDQAHEDPVLWPMRFPHTHDPNVKE